MDRKPSVAASGLSAETIRQALRRHPAPAFLLEGHAYRLTFDTRVVGVVLDAKLRARYPRTMTVILQYDYLVLDSDGPSFSLLLHFDGVQAILDIPYAAVLVFEDSGDGGPTPKR